MAAVVALLLAISASAASLSDNALGFEASDGNLNRDAASAPPIDWNSFASVTWTGTAPYQTATKTVSPWTFNGRHRRQSRRERHRLRGRDEAG